MKKALIYSCLLLISVKLVLIIMPPPFVTYCGPWTASSVLTISGASNRTISGDSISGGSFICINIINSNNIHITKSKFVNTTNFAIKITNSYNVTVDSCVFSNIGTAVFATDCPLGGIKVNANQATNVIRTLPFNHDFCQFVRVHGGGNQIMYNRVLEIAGQSAPEDEINMYSSSGLAGDPIHIGYNYLEGGGISKTGSGITIGDGNPTNPGGSYILVDSNRLVNTGYIGIQVAGGTFMTIQNNLIYSSCFTWSHLGLGAGNFTGGAYNNITVQNNRINWTQGLNPPCSRLDKSFEHGTTEPTGWATNISDNTLNSSILPSPLWPSCSPAVTIPVISYSPSVNTFVKNRPITPLVPINTGGNATSWSIDVGLPPGLNFNTSNGVISGIPTVTSLLHVYNVSASNSAGTGHTMVTITVINRPGGIFGVPKGKVIIKH